MTNPDTAAWWKHLSDLAENGPQPGEYAEAEEFIAAAEKMVNAAKALIHPGAVTPSHARLMRYPITSPTSEAKRPL